MNFGFNVVPSYTVCFGNINLSGENDMLVKCCQHLGIGKINMLYWLTKKYNHFPLLKDIMKFNHYKSTEVMKNSIS